MTLRQALELLERENLIARAMVSALRRVTVVDYDIRSSAASAGDLSRRAST